MSCKVGYYLKFSNIKTEYTTITSASISGNLLAMFVYITKHFLKCQAIYDIAIVCS